MRRFLLLALLLLTACGAPPVSFPSSFMEETISPSEEPVEESSSGFPFSFIQETLAPGEDAENPSVGFPSTILEQTSSPLATPTLSAPTKTAIPTNTLAPTVTLSPIPTETPMAGITPTATQLPPLDLPAELPNAPAQIAWDGLPTYLGDSKPGYYFRLKYDPDLWALTTDNYGYPAIGHRNILYCVISPASGHGLPAGIIVDHETRKIGEIEFEISAAYLNNIRQFVTYIGGDANIYTGFEIAFKDNADACLQDAEKVFATFISVKQSQATPIP